MRKSSGKVPSTYILYSSDTVYTRLARTHLDSPKTDAQSGRPRILAIDGNTGLARRDPKDTSQAVEVGTAPFTQARIEVAFHAQA